MDPSSAAAERKAQVVQRSVAAERKAQAVLRNIALHVAALTGAGTGDRAIFEGLRGAGGGALGGAGVIALMSSAMSCGGVLELLLTQGVGGLTDRIGRRWGFLVYPSYCMVGGLAVFAWPTSKRIVWANRMLVWSLGAIFGGIAHSGAAMSDVSTGPALAALYSQIYAYIGVGVLAGISTGSAAHRLLGARWAHLVRAAFGAVQLWHNYHFVEETLAPEKRNPAPLTLADVNPLRCLSLFRHSKGMSLTALAVTLAHTAEGKHTSDIRDGWTAEILKFPLATRTWFMNYWSCLAIAGGKVASRLVRSLGRRGFTTLTNALTAVGFYTVSIPREWAAWLGFAMMLPGFNANHGAGMKAYATDLAVAHRIGKGDFAASIAILRGISVIVAPTIYAALYARDMRRGQVPRSAWWSVAVIGAVVPEILHRMLSDEDLDAERIAAAEKQKEVVGVAEEEASF